MTWNDYEIEIFNHFKSSYPKANILHDTHIEGRYSKTKRQIDILIEDYVAGNKMWIVIDGKYFVKKIDVKAVEMFIGMLNDCGVNKGIMITNAGYSEAALNRAHNDSFDIELDILNFNDLYNYQAFGSISSIGKFGVRINAPFGWVMQASSIPNTLLTMYERGSTLEKAIEDCQWIYGNINPKSKEIKSISDVILFQEKDTLQGNPTAKISYLSTVKRDNYETKMRKITFNHLNFVEFTCFIDFGKFIFYAVLLTKPQLERKNLRKLENIFLQVTPVYVE